MSTVQMGMSEFDMLRDAKNKAEAEVERQRAIIKDLESHSRVIIKTERMPFDMERAEAEFIRFCRNKFSSRYYTPEECFELGVKAGLGSAVPSSQYIGFEDIKSQVEAAFNKQYTENVEALVKESKNIIKEYNDKLSRVSYEVHKDTDATISDLKQTIENQREEINKLTFDCKKQNEEIKTLKEACKPQHLTFFQLIRKFFKN